MKIPDSNNVYGYFICQSSLEKLADILRRTIFIVEGEVRVKKSKFDGTQTLQLFSDVAEFESTKFDNEGKYSLNGAVAGNNEQVSDFVEKIYEVLKQHDFSPVFEIYDGEHNFVKEFGA